MSGVRPGWQARIIAWVLVTAIWSMIAYGAWAFATWSLPIPGNGFRITVLLLAFVAAVFIETQESA